MKIDAIDVRRGSRLVLDGVSFTIKPGHVVGIVGPNGAGKSTLLSALYRALPLSSGTIIVGDDDLAHCSRRAIARQMAVVSQDSEQVMPLSVFDTVMLGRLPHQGLHHYGGSADRDLVADALSRVGMSNFAERLVTELSGGERQRVLIARAIAQRANFLLLDEPTNHLDIYHQFQLLELIATIASTTVVVLHDLNLAARICDDIVLLNAGQLVKAGPTAEIFDPELLSTIYRVRISRVDVDGESQLVFRPHSPTNPLLVVPTTDRKE